MTKKRHIREITIFCHRCKQEIYGRVAKIRKPICFDCKVKRRKRYHRLSTGLSTGKR